MVAANTDFGRVADDLRRAATSFALLTSQATLLGKSLQAFREFEKQLVLTNAIAQGSVAQFEQMSDAARNFALVTTTSAVEAGRALQQLAQAGFSAEESLAGIAGVLLLSQATLTDVAVSADLLSSNIRAFGLETTDTTRVANLFTAAITGSLATMDKLIFAMRQAGPVARVAGLSIEETTGFLGELFNIGLRGEQAGTTLRNIIVRLIRPTGEAADILRDLKVATLDATGNFRGLEAVMTDISALNLGEAQLAKIFEQEALAGALRILDVLKVSVGETTSQYRKFTNEITGTDRALIITLKNLDTFDGSMKLLRNSLNDAAITIGEALAPFVLELSEFVRDLVKEFNELDDATKKNIATWLGYTTAIVGVLASMNALVLLFRLLGLSLLPQLIGNIGLLGTRLLTLVPAATRAGAAIAGMTAAASAGGAAAGIASIAAFATGIGAIIAVAAAAAFAVSLIADEVRELDSLTVDLDIEIPDVPFKDLSDFEKGVSIAQQISATVGTDSEFAEAEERINIATRLINSDLIQLLAKGDVRQAISASQSAQVLLDPTNVSLTQNVVDFMDELIRNAEDDADEIRAQLAVLRAAEDEALAAASQLEADTEEAGFLGSIAQLLTVFDKAAAESALDKIRDDIGEERTALFQALKLKEDRAAELIAETEKALAAAVQAEVDGFKKLLNAAKQGNEVFGGVFAQFSEELTSTLSISNDIPISDTFKTVVEGLLKQLNTDGEVDLEAIGRVQEALEKGGIVNVLAEIFAAIDPTDEQQVALIISAGLAGNVEGIDENTLSDALAATNKEIIRKSFGSLASANEDLAGDIAEGRASLAQAQAKVADTLAEAITLETEAAIFDLDKTLQSIVDDLSTKYNEVFGTLPVDLVEGIGPAFDEAFASTGVELDLGTDAPTFASIIKGEFLTDSILSQIDESSTPEEVLAIAQAERTKFEAIMAAYITVLAETNLLTPEQLAELREFGAAQTTLATNAILEGILDLEATVESTTKKFASRGKSGGGSKIPKAVQDARKLEAAFNAAAKSATDARRKFVEAFDGFDLGQREAISLDLDIQDITNEFDNQISSIQKKLDDIKFNLGGNEELQASYQDTIAILEEAKQAEINAANSFTAQMERRSDAIDLYIRDLKNVSIAQDNTFSQVGAGLKAAFAEFNRDLITTFDIVQEAVLDFTSSISGSLADVIFEGESLFEAFGNTVLDISRKVFENFTNVLIQQTISSLAEGGGGLAGLLANAVSNGLGGGAVPGVGSAGGASAAGVSAGTTAVATALTTGAAQITAAFATIGPQLGASGLGVATDLTTSGNGVSGALDRTGDGVTRAGGGLFSVLNNLVSKLSGGGGGSSGGGFLSSLFGGGSSGGGGLLSLFSGSFTAGFAQGGQVTGAGTGTSDSILAFLSDKEFITNAAATKQYLPLLKAINDGLSPEKIFETFLGGAPKFATGGLVGEDFGSNSTTSSFDFLGSQVAGSSRAGSSGGNSGNITLAPVYHIAIASGDKKSADTFRRSANQHAKDMGEAINKSKRNL